MLLSILFFYLNIFLDKKIENNCYRFCRLYWGTFCHKLLSAGHEVIGLDNYINSDKKVSNFLLNNFDSYAFHQIDIAKEEISLDEIFKKHKGSIDCVVHFAALKAVGESESKPVQYWENNIFSTLNLIKTMKRHDLRKLIFFLICYSIWQ